MDGSAVDTHARLRALLETGIALSSELTLDSLLQRVVESAAELTGARYSALGVIDPTGTHLERFLTHGIDDETRREIGELPRGRGILGVLIRDATPLRLTDLTTDPRSVGFPPGHPPMHRFLGVPILLRGVAYGNLYLTEKEGGGEFTDDDQTVVTHLASQAAVAIENARLYESATRWLRQLESMMEVGDALATELDLGRLLRLIARRLRELVDARTVSIALPTPSGALRLEAVDGETSEETLGLHFDPQSSKVGRVFGRGRSERVDSVLEDPEIDQAAARAIGMRTALYVPMIARGRSIGVIVAADKQGPDPRFTHEDLRVAETLGRRAATAVDLSERVGRDTVRKVVEAQEAERRRLARELHDETGQALTSVLLGLSAAEEAADEEERGAALASVRELVVATAHDVRRLAVELRPKALDDFGLVPALERLGQSFGEQTGLVVDLEARLGPDRLPGDVETALYRIVQEALTNVAKHARATRVSILLTRKESAVAAIVEDDGVGFDPDAVREEGFGLLGMRERLALLGGSLAIEASEGAGTTLVAEVPFR